MPIEDDILRWASYPPTFFFENEEERFKYVEDSDTESDKRGVVLPEVHLLPTATGINDGNQSITMQ